MGSLRLCQALNLWPFFAALAALLVYSWLACRWVARIAIAEERWRVVRWLSRINQHELALRAARELPREEVWLDEPSS